MEQGCNRALEIFAIVGLDESAPPSAPHEKGSILYSLNFNKNGKFKLPEGLEMFCQPLGWKLSSRLERPQFIPFALTAENGQRTFCCSLVYYRMHTSRNAEQDKERPQSSEAPLDEGNEMFFEDCIQKMILYEPVCLCLISSIAIFDVLQKCLQFLYTSWIEQNNGSLEDSLKVLAEIYLPKPGSSGENLCLSPMISVYLPPFDSSISLPYTKTLAISLLRSIGVRNLVSLFGAILSDVSILFVSSSFVNLVDAQIGLTSIIFPLELGYSFVPVVPLSLLDFLQLPSTYIMGIHSSCAQQITGLDDTIVVDLDVGSLSLPNNISIVPFPEWILHPVMKSLKQVVDPKYHERDFAFAGNAKPEPEEFADKKVRAIFLNLIALLTGNLQEYVTVLRFQPQPTFYFDKKKFAVKYPTSQVTFVQKTWSVLNMLICSSVNFLPTLYKLQLCNSLAFANFVLQRVNPYRVCDFFDELLASLLNADQLKPENVFSSTHIGNVAQQLLTLMPCSQDDSLTDLTQWFDGHLSAYGQSSFPIPSEDLEFGTPPDDEMSSLTNLQRVPFIGAKKVSSAPMSTLETDRHVSLRRFFSHLFKNELLEARKYIHIIEEYLKHVNFQQCFVGELVSHLTLYGGSVSREQYDIFARIVNTAILYEEMAARLLPLLSAIYHKIAPDVKQELFTSVQNHFLWEDGEFWKSVLYAAVESELMRIYTPVSEEESDINSVPGGKDNDGASRKQFEKRSLKETLKRSLPRSAQLRGKEMKLPLRAEGIPDNKMSSQTGDGLLLLADSMSELSSLPSEMKDLCVAEEENAIFNQIFLCIRRIIDLRFPLKISSKESESQHFVDSLSEWICRFVRSVEVDLQLQERLSNRIVDIMVKEYVTLQLESIRSIENRLDQYSSTAPVLMLRPPFLEGEFLKKVVPAYLLPDGTASGIILPAEGYLFLSTYRLIFLGTPCSHGSQNEVVIKSLPLHSLFKVKELASCTVSCDSQSISVSKVMQLRTLASQFLKIGFEDSSSGSNIISHVIQLRYPEQLKVGLTVKKNSPKTKVRQKRKASLRQTKSRISSVDSDPTAISNLSLSSCCKEYSRVQLGTLNVKGSGTGQWRVSKVNMEYSVCSSYPCVVAIPEKLADQTLYGVASQFTDNRFPAATWRSLSNGATLLRSGSFKYKVPKQTPPIGIRQLCDDPSENKLHGIYNAEVESMIKSIIDITPLSKKKFVGDSLSAGVDPKSIATALQTSVNHVSDCEDDDQEPFRSHDDLSSEKPLADEMQDQSSPSVLRTQEVMSDSGDEDQVNHPRSDLLPIAEALSPDFSNLDRDESSMGFSCIPTNPVDWVTVDLLPDAIQLWKHSPLYVIGDKDRIKNIPKELYAGCVFVPVEVPEIQCIVKSFKKLTRACWPKSQKQQQYSSFLSDVEDSQWLNHLSTLLQLSVAVADLINIQGSSVLVALEKGMDVTAQVVSLAQLILDPYYRTIEGFRSLIEKDWMAFGHPFTKRNNQTLASAFKHELSPIFLQFLDCSHQILAQFPTLFEFNDNFLKTVAYHYSSSRFHTFCLNSEKERVDQGWCEYKHDQDPSHGDVEEVSSFWDYISTVDRNLPVFFNPLYDETSNTDVLQLQTYQANLDIWSFYTEESLSRFPKYDFELYSCSDVTVQDIQNEIFDPPCVKPLSSSDSATNYLELYLLKYIDLLKDVNQNSQEYTWRNLWEDLHKSLDSQFASVSHGAFVKGSHDKEIDIVKSLKNSLHRQTSLAVLMKTHLSVELKDSFNKPHCFIPHSTKYTVECDFCKHRIVTKQAQKCTRCSKFCHGHCKHRMPSNCGMKNYLSNSDLPPGVEDTFRVRQGSSTFYLETDRASHVYEGHLFKKGAIVKNWKQRWFVLDFEKGELSYYDPKDDDKCLGVIAIKDIQEITDVGSGHANVIPQGNFGYMFDVATSKRTYHLMAQDDVSRVSWMLRLNKARKISKV